MNSPGGEPDDRAFERLLEGDVTLNEPFESPAKRPCVEIVEPFHQEDVALSEPLHRLSGSECDNESLTSESNGTQSPSSSERTELSSDDQESVVESIDLQNPFEEFNPDLRAFCEGDGGEELYPRANVTLIQSLAILFDWFSACPGLSKEAFGRLLFLLHTFILPSGNKLPSTYYKAHAAISRQLVPVKEFHCCVNDCLLFRDSTSGLYANSDVCPKCGEARFQPQTSIPRKRFKYIPLVPRLRRMFANSRLSKLLQSHSSDGGDCTVVSDIHQSLAWTAKYAKNGSFEGDPRGLSIAFCTDGMNPFAKEGLSYSMWPITLTILNLPRHIRNLAGSILLTGIIPGRSEPKSLDPYLEVLADELLEMNGSEMYDGYRDESFQLKAELLLHILDYPGQNKVFHCQGAGAYAGCSYCSHVGQYSHILQKMVYPGNRRFLDPDHPIRKESAGFPDQSSDLTPPPILKTLEFVDKANSEYEMAPTKASKKRLAQISGCKGVYALRRLPSHERILNTPVEPMHLVKNIVEHIVNLLGGREDSLKVRKQEQQSQRFRSAWPKGESGTLPKAPFTLTKQEVALADQRAKSIHVPFGTDWQPRAIFGNPGGMKSHHWKEVATTGILKFCLRKMLNSKQRLSLFTLFDLLTDLCGEDMDSRCIDELEKRVHHALVLIERDFPVSLQVIVFHLLHHLPMFVRHFGPVYSFWMYPYERFNSWVSRRVTSRRYPEAVVVETYRLSEWAHFMEIAGQLPDGATTGVYAATLLGDHDEVSPQCHSQSQEIELSDQQFDQLKATYVANSAHQTEGGLEDVSRSATRKKHFTYTDHHYRNIKFAAAEVELEHSSTRSSYVFISGTEGIRVGRIICLFEHVHFSHATTFAYISWFDGPFTECDSNLLYVLTDTQIQSVISVASLSKPLITAFDEEEPGKLWILNVGRTRQNLDS